MAEKYFDYLVVGAGLAGCVFAYEATKRGKKVLVIDKRGHRGGNCYIENVDGIHVHKYGAHIFRTNDKEIFDYVSQFAELNNFINSPIAISGGNVYNLPFNMNTFHKLFGCVTPEEAMRSIERTKVACDNPKNLEEHCLATVGFVVYETLIKEYTEKQWGRKCSDLPVETMKRIPIRMTYDNNYYNAKYQGCFDYNVMFDKMLSDCCVMTNADFFKNRTMFESLAKKIVYTGSVDELFDYKFGELEYRGLKFEHELFECENKQGVAVVNYSDKAIPWTRTIEHKHFMGDVSDKTIVTKEYPVKWLKGSERYYPVNDEENNARYEKYRELAQKEGFILCGRLAEYKYYDMQDTIRSSLLIAKGELD